MHDKVGRLIDDDELIILIDDIERHFFRPRYCGLGLGHRDRKGFTWFDPVCPVSYGFRHPAGDIAGADQRLNSCAAEPLGLLCQEAVQTGPGVFLPYGYRD